MMTERRATALALILCVFGVALGISLGQNEQLDSQSPTPTPTVTKTVTPEPKEVPVPKPWPASCEKVYKDFLDLEAAWKAYEAFIGPELGVQDRSYTAIAGKDFLALNRLVAQQRAIMGGTLDSASVIFNKSPQLKTDMQACKADAG